MAVDSSKREDKQGRLKGTHKVSKLIQLVDKATRNFVAVGEDIASENPEFQVREKSSSPKLPGEAYIGDKAKPDYRIIIISSPCDICHANS